MPTAQTTHSKPARAEFASSSRVDLQMASSLKTCRPARIACDIE